jgi:hypothetical protein
MAETEQLIIRCNEELATALKETLEGVEGAESRLTQQRHMSGDISNYVLIAHFTLSTLTLLINRLKSVPDLLPIRSLEIGDLKLKNLTRVEAEHALREYLGKKSASGKKSSPGK